MFLLGVACSSLSVSNKTNIAGDNKHSVSSETLMQELSLSSDQDSESYGITVSGAGDVNGDGFGDVIVGMPYAYASKGAAYLYYGSTSGSDVTSVIELRSPEPGEDNSFGGVLKWIGDINGDSFDDIAVNSSNSKETGKVYIFHGSDSGVDANAAVSIEPSDPGIGASFGAAISGRADLNGDGYDDLVIGSPNDDDDYENSGSIYVYYGSSVGLDLDSEVKIYPSDRDTSDRFGSALATAGDLNNDGYGDVLIGAPYALDNQGSVYVFYGSATGLMTTESLKITASDANNAEYFGKSVAGVGDINGDGHGDLLIGAPYDDSSGSDSGSVYIYYGSDTGGFIEQKLVAFDGDHNDRYGSALSASGDLDGDGFADVVIGSGVVDGDKIEDVGAAYVYYGSTNGLDEAFGVKIIRETMEELRFGSSLSSAGDVDADGFDDLIIGAYGYDDSRGAAYIIYGQLRDQDGDGASSQVDCDDTDANVGEPSERHPDSDGDGYGDHATSEAVCPEEAGYLDDDSDCDDSNPDINLPYIQYADNDGDGFGDVELSGEACPDDEGYTEDRTDCDDTEPTTYPGASDICGDGIDSDCDGWGYPWDDEDADGLSHAEELVLGTDPCDEDTDNDGILDGLDENPLGEVDTGDPEKIQAPDCGCGGGTMAWVLIFPAFLRRFSRTPAEDRQLDNAPDGNDIEKGSHTYI
jgi:hypothetical protein